MNLIEKKILTKKSSLGGIFVTAIIVIWVLLVLLPISPFNMPLSFTDSGVFLYTGWQILDGNIHILMCGITNLQ